MNRYPIWKYVLIVVALLFGVLYSAPNYFGSSPAVQVTSGKSTNKITPDLTFKVAGVLAKAGITSESIAFDNSGANAFVHARFATPDIQFKAKSALEKGLNADPEDPSWLVALNLEANTPQWMQSLKALPMYLGLDLRGACTS